MICPKCKHDFIPDNRTSQQNKYLHAILGEIAEHTGHSINQMKQIEIDALDKACIKFNGFPKGLHESTEDEKNKILNKVIDKIEEKGVAK